MSKQLSNVEKAALTLLSLGRDVTSSVLKHLPEAEVKRITRAFHELSEVDRNTQLNVNKEFSRLIQAADRVVFDGKKFAAEIFNDPELAMGGGTMENSVSGLFDAISEQRMIQFVRSEHPQTIAFLLTQLSPQQAAKVLEALSEEEQGDIIQRLARIESVSHEVIAEVREALASQLRADRSGNAESIEGARIAAEILNRLPRASEERILSEIDEVTPEMAERVRELMFTFEDLFELDDRSFQTFLKEVPREDLVLALKMATDSQKKKVWNNVSERASLLLREDLEGLGPRKKRDVDLAQRNLIDIARRIEAEGRITFGKSDSDEYV